MLKTINSPPFNLYSLRTVFQVRNKKILEQARSSIFMYLIKHLKNKIYQYKYN